MPSLLEDNLKIIASSSFIYKSFNKPFCLKKSLKVLAFLKVSGSIRRS